MKNVEIKVLGVTTNYDVTETVEEMNKLAGFDAAHNLALNQVMAHNVYGKIRATVVGKLEERFKDDPTSLPKTKEEKVGDKTITRVIESDAVYVQRLVAAGKITDADLAKLVADAAAAYPIGEALKVKPRESKPKTISKTLRVKLEGLDEKKRGALAKKLTKALGRTVDPTNIEELGFAYLENRRNEEKKAEQEFFA